MDTAPKLFTKEFRALGTSIRIFIVTENEKEEDQALKDGEELEKLYREKESRLSRFSAESELSKLNSQLGVWQAASPDILHLASQSLVYHQESDGLFDPRVLEQLETIGYAKSFYDADFGQYSNSETTSPLVEDISQDLVINKDKVLFRRRIDFGGIAKGYITDCAAGFLRSRNWKNFLVDSGGDMFAEGHNERSLSWHLGLEGVNNRSLQLVLSDEGIATSGVSNRKWETQGKRVHHLIDPKNPDHFSFDVKTVTVIAKTTEEADVWAKAMFLLGIDKGTEYANLHNVAVIYLSYRGNISISRAARPYLAVL